MFPFIKIEDFPIDDFLPKGVEPILEIPKVEVAFKENIVEEKKIFEPKRMIDLEGF